MPFALILIGLLLVVSGARGTYGDLKQLLVHDFSGEGNFFYWVISIGVVGALGYVPGFERFSRTFIALILIALVLSEQGFFRKFSDAFHGLNASEGGGGGAQRSGASGAPSLGTPSVDMAGAIPSALGQLGAIGSNTMRELGTLGAIGSAIGGALGF